MTAALESSSDVQERSFVDDLAEVYGPIIRRAADRITGRRDSHAVEQPLSVDADQPIVQRKTRNVVAPISSANATVVNAVVGIATNNATAVAALKDASRDKRASDGALVRA